MTDQQKNQGEGNKEAAREFNKDQEEFAKNGPVKEKAQEAADALDGSEGEDLEKARKDSGEVK